MSDEPSSNNPAESGEGSQGGQRVLLLTGLSGAGKSTALQVLEDLGWEVIDNLPVRFLATLAADPGQNHAPVAICFDSRTRHFDPAEIIALTKRLSAQPGVHVSSLFMDCAAAELERRYNETRRRHPMAVDRPVQEGIRADSELMEPLRHWADDVLDTSTLAANQLQQKMRELFAGDASQPLTLTISSFGFAKGMPPLADMVFDMRFLDNPHWVADLREKTGLDQAVADHIRQDANFAPNFNRIRDLVLGLLPSYHAQGKAYVHIAFGCTGGRHRSVFTAEEMARDLRKEGFSPTVRHHNLGSQATDAIEELAP